MCMDCSQFLPYTWVHFEQNLPYAWVRFRREVGGGSAVPPPPPGSSSSSRRSCTRSHGLKCEFPLCNHAL